MTALSDRSAVHRVTDGDLSLLCAFVQANSGRERAIAIPASHRKTTQLRATEVLPNQRRNTAIAATYFYSNPSSLPLVAAWLEHQLLDLIDHCPSRRLSPLAPYSCECVL